MKFVDLIKLSDMFITGVTGKEGIRKTLFSLKGRIDTLPIGHPARFAFMQLDLSLFQVEAGLDLLARCMIIDHGVETWEYAIDYITQGVDISAHALRQLQAALKG